MGLCLSSCSIIYHPTIKLDSVTIKNKLSSVELTNPLESQLRQEPKQAVKESEIPLSVSRKRTEKDVDEAIDRIKNSKELDTTNHEPIVVEINPKELEYARIEGEKFKEALAKAYTSSKPGELLEITGFAFLQEEFKDNQFMASRLVMTCCVADTSLIGLLSDSSDLDINIVEGKWYRLKGKISSTTMKDPITKENSKVPLLKLIEAEEIETPISPYIYP